MRKYLLFLLFLFLFVFESMFVQSFSYLWLEKDLILVPHFLFISLLCFVIFAGRNQGLVYGVIFGLLFDVVYTEIIGIYLFLIPLLAYLILKLMKFLQTHAVIVTIIVMLAVVVLELIVYEINVFLHITNMDMKMFIQSRLLPTVICNFIFTILLVYPFKKMFTKTKEEVEREESFL